MRLIWTKNSTAMSKLIRWALDEPCSHFAVVFDDRFAVHSNLLGMQLNWYKSFLAMGHTEVVYEIDPKISPEAEAKVFTTVMDGFDRSGYDFGAFAFFCYAALRKKLLGTPIPTRNPWGRPKSFLCTEAYELLGDVGLPSFGDVKLDMTSPEQLYRIIKVRMEARDIPASTMVSDEAVKE
jgi:hypothetical protein